MDMFFVTEIHSVMRRVTLSHIFANLFTVTYLLPYSSRHVLAKINEENPSSHRYVIGKGRGILTDCSVTYGYSLIPYQT